MSNVTVKPTVSSVIDRFRVYHETWPAWGSLHVVLDDLNVDDACVEHARQWALEEGDAEGAELARILRAMTVTQRLKIARLA